MVSVQPPGAQHAPFGGGVQGFTPHATPPLQLVLFDAVQAACESRLHAPVAALQHAPMTAPHGPGEQVPSMVHRVAAFGHWGNQAMVHWL